MSEKTDGFAEYSPPQVIGKQGGSDEAPPRGRQAAEMKQPSFQIPREIQASILRE